MKDTVSFHFLLVYDVYYYFQIKEMERIVVGFVFFFFFLVFLIFFHCVRRVEIGNCSFIRIRGNRIFFSFLNFGSFLN